MRYAYSVRRTPVMFRRYVYNDLATTSCYTNKLLLFMLQMAAAIHDSVSVTVAGKKGLGSRCVWDRFRHCGVLGILALFQEYRAAGLLVCDRVRALCACLGCRLCACVHIHVCACVYIEACHFLPLVCWFVSVSGHSAWPF